VDATAEEPEPLPEGDPAGVWGPITRGDALLIRKAIREGWATPAGRRGPIMAALHRSLADPASGGRVALAIIRTFTVADRQNAEADWAEMREAIRADRAEAKARLLASRRPGRSTGKSSP